LLQKQHNAGERAYPSLTQNLIKLMLSLGRAALGRRAR
jgi:hypothetical protein